MGALPTVAMAWAAVYGYVSLFFCLLYARRPTDSEYASFGFIAAGLCIFSAAKAVVMQASTIDEAVAASRLSWSGIMIVIPFFVHFCHALVGRKTRLRTLAFVWGGIGVVGSLLGLTVDANHLEGTPLFGFAAAPNYIQPRVTVFGLILLAGAVALPLAALARLAPSARYERDARLVLIGTGLAMLAGLNDVLVRLGLLRSVYLFEHAAMAVIVVFGYLLLNRFVETSSELRVRTEELRRSYHALRRTQERLVRREQLAAVGELSAVIAHEVRNPLAIIKNAVSGLRRRNLGSDDRRTLLGILGEETNRLTRLVDDLIAYARPMIPEDRSVHLDELVWGAVDLARSGNPHATAVAVTVDLHTAPETVHGDPALLRQAIMNIVDNAMQAMPLGGELTIKARPTKLDDAAGLAIEVHDTGEGMDTLVRERAKNPFFTTRPAGTGLGLAIVERVVRNHGGSLTIESRHGVGTSVTITLPHLGRQSSPDQVSADASDATPHAQPGGP